MSAINPTYFILYPFLYRRTRGKKKKRKEKKRKYNDDFKI